MFAPQTERLCCENRKFSMKPEGHRLLPGFTAPQTERLCCDRMEIFNEIDGASMTLGKDHGERRKHEI